jgi:two-component system KDP operon response regulator KdpE
MAMAPRVLVIDDETAIRRMLHAVLMSQGYDVIEAATAQAARQAAQCAPAIDIALLDLGLPDMDGLKLIGELRASGSTFPIVVLSSRMEEISKVAALDLGADDYVTKPFGPAELLARLRTALRHRLQMVGEAPVFCCGALTVDLVRRVVTLAGKVVKLSPKEYALLRLFVGHPGKVLTHKFILREIWDEAADIQNLRLFIRALRQKLEEAPERPRYILTEQGVGYRFSDAELRE